MLQATQLGVHATHKRVEVHAHLATNARAGVERLGLKKYISSYIPKEILLPAVGQGALGIEIREGDEFTKSIISKLHHEDTYKAVLAERALLRELEGGCQVPIGAHAYVNVAGLYLDGIVGSIDGTVTYRKKLRGSKNDPEKLGKNLATELKKAGAGEILAEIYSSVRLK